MVDFEALVSFIVSSLVTKSDDVQVSSARDDNGILRISVRVAKEDTGRVIGRRGATISAIRQLVRISASRVGETVEVDVEESE